MTAAANLFADLPAAPQAEELAAVLAAGRAVRIERIVSSGQASPPGFWYDQDEAEWVALLAGAAGLRFEDGSITLKAGDWVMIPAHRRHRVEWTTTPTVWLAVFFQA